LVLNFRGEVPRRRAPKWHTVSVLQQAMNFALVVMAAALDSGKNHDR
jgi:hypothetical protein